MTNNTEGREGWIYFILSDYAIKIGFSIYPQRRLESLQISNHHTLEILATVPTSLITEREAHRHFKHLRIRGEWFHAERDLLEFIEALKAGRNLIRDPKPKKPVSSEVAQLIGMRAKYGADSPKGHACSNVIEQLDALKDYVRPEWASHECQTLPWMMKQQMNRLSN